MCGLHNFPDKRFDEQNLQGQVSFSPRNDKPYIWNDPHKPKDLHELYPVKIACDAFSEKEYLDAGIRTYLKQRFDNGLSIGLCSTVSEESKEDAEIDITSSLLKRCSKCELQWPIGKQICMEPYGCGKALPAESVYKLGKGTKTNAGETFFGATRDNLKNTSGFAKSYTSSGFISSKVNLSDSGDSNAGSDKKVAHTSSIGNSCAVDGLATKSMYEPVTSLPQNPCNAESQQAVLEKIGELAKLPFFVPPYEVKRQWVELTADLGACKTLFDKFEDKDEKFSAFRYVMPTGHQYMSNMKVVLKLMLELGYDVLGKGYGFWSPKQIVILFAGFDTHVCIDFILEVYRPLFTDKLIQAFWDKCEADKKNDFDELQKWIRESAEANTNFRCHLFLLQEVCSGIASQRMGIRMNIAAQHAAGTKILLPFLGSLNHSDYFKAECLNIERYNYRCPTEIQQLNRNHFSFGNEEGSMEGPDFLCEGTIKDLKPGITSNTLEGFQVATSLVGNKYSLRDTIYRETGHSQITYDLQRAPTNFTSAIAAISKDCKDMNPFHMHDQYQRLDGTKLPESSEIDRLFTKGKKDCEDFIMKRITPKVVPLKYQVDRKNAIESGSIAANDINDTAERAHNRDNTDEQSQWEHAAFNDQVDPEEDIVTGSEDII